MEKTQKRIIPKKLLVVVPLCLILLVVSVVSKEESPEIPEPFFQDGIYYDPIIPEIAILPLNYSTFEPMSSASTTYPLNTIGLSDVAGDGKITLYILIAYDDDFLSHSYETPKGIKSAVDYARQRTWSAFVWFWVLCDVRFMICGEVTWHSDSSSDTGMFYEAIQEIGFVKGNYYNGFQAEALIAWTTAFKEFRGLGSSELATAMISSQGYVWDDNIAQHELSHVNNATDGGSEFYNRNECYFSECIMSYRLEYVGDWYEDGKTWEINEMIPQAFITHIYCEDSFNEIYKWLHNHYEPLWIMDRWDDC